MKLNCGLPRHLRQQAKVEAKKEKLEQWHDWFAWYPVRIGSEDCRWLETVGRRCCVSSNSGRVWFVKYKAKDKQHALPTM